MSDLLSFIGELVTARGGVVERAPGGARAEALVSEELAERLGLPGTMVLLEATDGPGAPGALGGSGEADGASMDDPEYPRVQVGYGLALLERAVELARQGGRLAAVSIAGAIGSKAMAEVVSRQLILANGTFRLVGSQETWRDYGLYSFTTVMEADERREGILHVAVSSRGAVVPGLAERILAEAPGARELGPGETDASLGGMGRHYLAAASGALEELSALADPFRAGVRRRLRRDAARIRAYFADLEAEMAQEIRRRRLEGEARALREEKIALYRREAAQKREGLREKYRIRLGAEPFALLVARIPVLRCDLEVKRRKRELRLEVEYNGLTKRVDPLPCEACGAPTLEVGLCDEALHRLCPACLEESDGRGRRNCPRCKGRRPPASVEALTRRWSAGGHGAGARRGVPS